MRFKSFHCILLHLLQKKNGVRFASAVYLFFFVYFVLVSQFFLFDQVIILIITGKHEALKHLETMKLIHKTPPQRIMFWVEKVVFLVECLKVERACLGF